MCNMDCDNCTLPANKCRGGNEKKTANLIPNRAIIGVKRSDGIGRIKMTTGCRNNGKYMA